jgi:hypothetical protein
MHKSERNIITAEKDVEYCRVCGETNSAGWHCGTITCEACKKFYLRNIKDDEYKQLQCSHNNNCVITRQTRTSCPYCRFMKCVQIGMKQTEVRHEPSLAIKEIDCSVCGEAASGLHFGAITCEGCKVSNQF